MSSENEPQKDMDTGVKDVYLACALKLAELGGRPTSPNSLTVGLPLTMGLLTPELFISAVDRIDYKAIHIEKSLNDFLDHTPCLLLLKDNQIALVRRMNAHEAEVYNPSKGHDFYTISMNDLQHLYEGEVILIKDAPSFENVDTGKPLKPKDHWLWHTLWTFRRIYYQVGIAAFATNLLAILLPLYSLNVYDRVIPNSSFPTLWVLSFGILVAFVFDFILKMIKGHYVDIVSKKSDTILSNLLVNKILSLPMSRQSLSVGSLIQHVKELETIRDFFSSATLVSFIDLPFGVLTLIFIGIIGGIWLFLMGLTSMIIVFCVGIMFQRIISRNMQQNFLLKNHKSNFLAELVSGLENVKGIVAEGRMQKNWDSLSEEHAKTSQSMNFSSTMSGSIFSLIQNLNYVLFVIIGVFLIIGGELTMGGLIACTILSSRAIMPMVQGAALITKYSQVKIAYRTINAIMDLPSERITDHAYIPHPIVKGDIKFENVTFRYGEDSHDILKNISFHIEPGDKLAILGRIGSGKSTIEKLLMGFYQPQQGNILVDGIDIRQIDPADLRANICYLPQDVYLFSGTISHNILMSDRPLEQHQVDDAVNRSGVAEFIRHHPQGFNAQVGEGGKWLSGGQKQSIGLARAFLHPAPILILDEPTAMMDARTEQQLFMNLNHLTKNRTLIVVTHNVNFLSIINKVLLLDNGAVQFFGTRDAFIAMMQKQQNAQDTHINHGAKDPQKPEESQKLQEDSNKRKTPITGKKSNADDKVPLS